jgi:hypothetical protein
VRIRLADDGRLLHFYVADDGPGSFSPGRGWVRADEHAGPSRGGRRPGLDRFISGPGRSGSRPDPDERKEGDPAELLTECDNRVLRLPRGSPPLPEIAIELWLSPNTIKAHTQGHLPQLGVSTGGDAITRGQETGIR